MKKRTPAVEGRFYPSSKTRILDQIEKILKLGVEKIVINSHAVIQADLITQAARVFGSQSVVVSMDVKQGLIG